MNRLKYLIIILFISVIAIVDAKEIKNYKDLSLKEMGRDRDLYIKKEITLKLKLKNIDYNFYKVVFYDKNNHDLIFSFTDKDKKKRLKKSFASIHEGEDYYVVFRVDSIDSNGVLSGYLIEFIPTLLYKIID